MIEASCIDVVKAAQTVLEEGKTRYAAGKAAGIALDEATATATGREGVPVPLTRRELALLRALIRHPGAVLSCAQLESQV